MHFKKLELVGFKSFMDKTTLHFEPGLTAIVGPNGTGKSNLFDAMRWVLGEQSVKALRGSQMQDVIFNGTDSKEPLGLAEVSLTFDNTNRFFSIDHQEVVITRRIFRSGESEYLLNKLEVRLKDVLDLLMGTGIGAESYSLVEQGKIDLILSSRPEDRRLVFDEASGITKYKSQKKEAMRKLEETEQNLLRVNDIITEVKRQIGSLERQANKARRYKEVFEELKSKEINLAVYQKRDLMQQKDTIINALSQLETEEARLLNIIKEQESRMNNRQAELKMLEESIMDIKNQILNLDNLATRNKEHINFNQQRLIELDTNTRYLEVQMSEVKQKLVLDEEKLNNVKEEYSGIQKNIEEKTAELKEKEDQLNALASSIKVSLQNITGAKKGILELVSKIVNTKNEITDLMSKQQVYLARKRRLELEKAKVNEEKDATEENLKDIAQELESLNKIIADLNLRISHLKNELGKEVLSLNSINADIENLEKQLLTLQSHKEFIEKLKTAYEDISETMNAVVYLDKLPAVNTTGLVVKIKGIEETNLNGSTALTINTEPFDSLRSLRANAEPVEAEQSRSVKLSGEAKPIDLDTRKISQRIEQIQGQIHTLKNTQVAKEGRIEELNKLIQELQQELRSQEVALSNKKTSYQSILGQLNKMKEEQDLILMELSEVEKELSVLEEKLTGLKSELADLDKQHKQTEDLITNEQNNIVLNSDLKEKVLVIITQTKTEVEALRKRINSDEVTLEILEDTYRHDKDNLNNIQRQTQETQDKKKSLELEIEDLEGKINEAVSLSQKQKDSLKEAQEQYSRISGGVSGEFKKIDLDRKELDALKNKLYELQMQNKDLDFKILSIKDRILQVYKMDLDTFEDIIPEGDESRPCVQERDQDMLSQEIQRLKEKLDAYGTVNLVAIEEYDELKKRYDFLTQQQNDLISARDSLHEAILKINRTAKKMFLDTFEQIRQEFRNYFRLLFNGGDAQIFLIDEQDPLESGIEIICRPVGKKLQNVLLLSGGEKSLSAIALIFAIFKVKPSPFCVLDEIDAALDEANVDRFGRILQEFTKDSQFIVITHNKRTIANADIMYGITMEESGVSKIVSVKFAKEPDVAVAEPV